MSRFRRGIALAIGLASALSMLGLVGCSSSAPQSNDSLKHTELTFNLGACQSLGSGLYKCPAVDKPVCNPDYVGTNVQCVRIDKDGKVIVQQMEQ